MTITLLGFPWDASSSHARGPALAPATIKALLSSEASSPYSLSGIDVSEAITTHHIADLPSDAAKARAAITARVKTAISNNEKPLSVGGDHSVTFPILEAIKDQYGAVNVLHFDAHPDLYDELDGDCFSHACPFARSLESRSINNLVQVGIRSATPEQRALGAKHNVTMLGAEEWDRVPFERLTGPVYVSIDLDGLDPAFAPGVSHPEPGGLSTREVLAILSKLEGDLIAADVVELNPEKDINLLTAHVAVRLVKELAAKMV